MPSLHQLLAEHSPLLVLDAASVRIQAGCLAAGEPARWAHSSEEAGIGVFVAVDALGIELAGIRAFAFCEGPGSILGTRTVAMALRTWTALAPRPVFAYASLALASAAHGRPGAALIADARRDSWHHYPEGGPLQRLPTAALGGPLLMPEGFRHWTPLPPGVERVPYDLSDLLPRTATADLFRAVEAPDALLPAEPSYATWTPRIHRAP